MALQVLIILLSLFASGLLVGDEMAVAGFIHPVLYSVFEEAHHAVLVRDPSGIRDPANADHASFALLDREGQSVDREHCGAAQPAPKGSFSMSKSTLFTRHHYRSGFAVQSRHQGGERCVHSVLQPWG